MLKHLDIADYHKHSISNLVINSASWKQLTSLGTCDDEVLSMGSDVFCSLKKLNLSCTEISGTGMRVWPNLEEIQIGGDTMLEFIAEHVKDLFPALSIVRMFEFSHPFEYVQVV